MARDGNKPIKEFRVGVIKGSIWMDKTTSEKGYPMTLYSVKITKSYKDSKDNWKETDCYFAEDLPKLLLVAEACWKFVAFKQGESEAK